MSTPPPTELENLSELCSEFARAFYTPPEPRAPKPQKVLSTYVVDRFGRKVPVLFDKITMRNEELCGGEFGPELRDIDPPAVTAEVVRRFRNGMTTRELDAETVAICIANSTSSSDYDCLAARIAVSDLKKRTPASLSAMVDIILARAPSRRAVRLTDEFIEIVRRSQAQVDAALAGERDYNFRYFGWQTIARSYLLRPQPRTEDDTILENAQMESPQHLYMRVALGIFVCQPDGRGHLAPDNLFTARVDLAVQFYNALSTQRVSNATPTMLNAGTARPQMSSCFQIALGDDLTSIFDTVKAAGLISRCSGGISLWVHNVRAEGALIHGTGGRTSSIARMLKIFEDTQRYANQGGNRPGAFAIYLAADHADVLTFLGLARHKGVDIPVPYLKYALWVPDLFMEALEAEVLNRDRVSAGGYNDLSAGDWFLFSPDEAPGLHLVYGEEYRALYGRYVAEGRFRAKIKASELIDVAFITWSQAGNPYVLFKDHCNRKSNMQNVAPICSSNLCTEILIPSWSAHDAAEFGRFHPGNAAGGEYGVCNLAAICLESYIVEDGSAGTSITDNGAGTSVAGARLDYGAIIAAAGFEAAALNRVIDLNHYPTAECERSNRRHRPIGIGIMGLADVLARLRLAFGSEPALAVTRAVAACVYYGAMAESAALARKEGAYATFAGSPASEGRLQPDLWQELGHLAPGWEAAVAATTGGALTAVHWAALRADGRGKGFRNAYTTAWMPTASTSNIVGQNECFEPFTTNIYTRKTQAGQFTIVNRHLLRELTELGLWDEELRQQVVNDAGSIQAIERIPANVRRRYKTAREIHPTLFIRNAAAAAPFIDQSMSMNMYLNEPSLPKILRFLFEGWKAGLKTGMYYLHVKPAAGAQKTVVVAAPAAEEPVLVCTREAGCTSCSV